MYVVVEANDNCEGDERMFPTHGPEKTVVQVQLERKDKGVIWCDVVGVDEGGTFSAAHAVQMDDSSAGVAWLIRGGAWGLRLRPSGSGGDWSLKAPDQWGMPFLVLDYSDSGIKFA